MSGGADAESVESARRYAPLALPGVAKVAAETVAWNRVDLYVVPAGEELAGVSADLRTRLIAWFEDRRMIGTSIRIRDARPVEIEVGVEILVEHWADEDAVLRHVEAAVQNLYALENVNFGDSLFVSKVFEAAEAIEGVRAANVTTFGRLSELSLLPIEIAKREGRLQVKGFNRKSLYRLPPEGRISLSKFEVPTLGQLRVRLGRSG